MQTISIIVAASGWAVTAVWGLWLWHHKRKIGREPEKIEAELRLIDAQTEKLRVEKKHLDAQLEALQEKQCEDRDHAVGVGIMRQERDTAIRTLDAYRKLHEEILGLSGLVQAYYAGRYAWVLHGMHPGMLEAASPDKVLEAARETFLNGRRLAIKYAAESDRIDDLQILAKRLRWEDAK